jgi:hypothetical protein
VDLSVIFGIERAMFHVQLFGSDRQHKTIFVGVEADRDEPGKRVLQRIAQLTRIFASRPAS